MFKAKLDQDADSQPSFSPSPMRKPTTTNMEMDFVKAIQAVIAGEKITKREWNDPEIFGVMRDGYLRLIKHGVSNVWIVNDGDLLGNDWVILIG